MNNFSKSAKIPFFTAVAAGIIVAIFSSLALMLILSFDFTVLGKFIVILSGAILSGVTLSMGGQFFLPLFSQITSVWQRVYRFESLSHPLLLRLSYEAPGTFHHAINVSILAQKAAKKIGADSLLVRVASYYHDIGKLENPIQYIENQAGNEIPRDENAESIHREANKIIGHVKKGMEIARQYHLPEELIEIISEHHGSTRVLYYYEKAKEQGLRIKRTDFKYEGPAPQSRESAILMLADSCEAATRAIPNLTSMIIAETVNATCEDKISEKQLNNCGLTPHEIAAVKTSLTETLDSIYHQRIISK